MAICMLDNTVDNPIDGNYSSCSCVQSRRHGLVIVPVVASSLRSADMQVDHSNKLAPTDNLSNESFDGIERVGIDESERSIDDLFWRQESDIQHWRQNTVKKKSLLAIDRIFIVSKRRKSILEEMFKPGLCIGVRNRICKTVCVS